MNTLKVLKLTAAASAFMFSACQQAQPDKTERQMDSLLAKFVPQWKEDSLGQNGFRIKQQYTLDSANMSWLINGLDFKAYDTVQILKWFGKPTYCERHKEDNHIII